MASLMMELARSYEGRVVRHRTVGDKNASKRLHIYFSMESRQRFVMTEENREFTELRQEEKGKSLIAIEGECETELGIN